MALSAWWRRYAPLVVVLALVGGTGLFGVAAARAATGTATDVHTADREAFRSAVGRMMAGYTLSALSSLQEKTGDPFSLVAGDPADRAALVRLVDGSPFFGEGAVLTDLVGQPLTAYTPGGPVPPISDPAYRPLITALGRGEPGISSVIRAGDRSLVAYALPVTTGGAPRGLLVGFERYDVSGPSKRFLDGLPIAERARLYLLDRDGTVVASNDLAAVGTAGSSGRALQAAAAGSAGVLTDERDGVAYVDAYERIPGTTGWTLVVAEPAEDFYGPINSGGTAVQIALLVVLVAAASTVLVLHHRRQLVVQELAGQALRDPLTGLPNRILFQSRLDAALNPGAVPARRIALLFCDLDGFKAVNDSYGHSAGDQLLVAVGARLRSCVRACDLVARMGGDEFTVLIEGGEESGPELTHRATEVARRIGEVIREPVDLGLGRPSVHVGVSIGVSVHEPREQADRPGVSADGAATELLKLADAAMYAAKTSRSGLELARFGAPG